MADIEAFIKSHKESVKKKVKITPSQKSARVTQEVILLNLKKMPPNDQVTDIINRIESLDMTKIEGEKKEKIEKIFALINGDTNNISNGLSYTTALVHTIAIENLYKQYIGKKESITKDSKKGTEEVTEEVTRIQELEEKYFNDFGENWGNIKRIWNIKTTEDYNMLEKTLDLGGGIIYNIFDAGIDFLNFFGQEGLYNLGIVPLYHSIKYLLKKDFEIISSLYDDDRNFLLFLFVYVQINSGLVGYRYMRDYLTSQYGDSLNKSKPKTVKKKRISEDGIERIERIEKDRFLKRWLGSRYIDAVDSRSNIFSLSDNVESLSADQNEYLKRRKTMDILKKYYFDNPKLYRRLQKIETRFLQANSFTYWREIYFLLEEHGKIRRIIGGALKAELPLIGKTELEQSVISKREELQKGHFSAISKLYSTNESPDGDSINIDKDKKTDFLKGLIGEIENNPNISKREKGKRLANLDNYLNSITGNTVVSKDRMMQELVSIKDGEITKLSMLGEIEGELNQLKKLGFLKRGISNAAKLVFLGRKRNLQKLQKVISDGDWHGTRAEFTELLEKVKKSKGKAKIPRIKKDFGNIKKFEEDVKTSKIEFDERVKLYKGDSIEGLGNYIKYILPNADETSYIEVFNDFKENKSLYKDLDFYRELFRIKEGFLPSNAILEKLDSIKMVLEKEKNSLEKEKKGILKKIRNLEFVVTRSDNNEIKVSDKIMVKENIDMSIIQFKEGDYKGALKSLSEIVSKVSGKTKIMLGNIIERIKRMLSVRLRGKYNPSTKKLILDEKINRVDDFIKSAQKGELDIKESSLKEIKPDNILDFGVRDFSAGDFSETDRNNLKSELKGYKDLNNHDLKNILAKSSNPTEINESLQKRYGQELDLFKTILFIKNKDPKWVDIQIGELSNSLQENDYSIGQVREIMKKIIGGTPFEDTNIDEIIKNTSDHSTPFDEKKKLMAGLTNSYNRLDHEKKIAVKTWIVNQGIEIKNMPESLSQDFEKIKRAESSSDEIKRHQGNIRGMTNQIERANNMEELNNLQNRFYNYIDAPENKIDSTSDDFKSIIEEFNNSWNTKMEEVSVAEKIAKEKAAAKKKAAKKAAAKTEILSKTEKEALKKSGYEMLYRLDLEIKLNGPDVGEDIKIRTIQGDIRKGIEDGEIKNTDDLSKMMHTIGKEKGYSGSIRSIEDIKEDIRMRDKTTDEMKNQLTSKTSPASFYKYISDSIKNGSILKKAS